MADDDTNIPGAEPVTGNAALRSGRGMRFGLSVAIAVAVHLLVILAIVIGFKLQNPFLDPEPPQVGVLPYQLAGEDVGGQPVEAPTDEPQDVEVEKDKTPDPQPTTEPPNPDDVKIDKTIDADDKAKEDRKDEVAQAKDAMAQAQKALGEALRKKLQEQAGKPGPGGEDGDYKDRPGPEAWGRWVILYQTGSADYTRSLDFFKCEIGVSDDARTMQYFYNLSAAKPSTRRGAVGDERRMNWFPKDMRSMPVDVRLAQQAGYQGGGVIIHFYPIAVERTLADLERREADRKGVDQPHRTIFRARRTGAGYEFYVHRQD